MSVPGSHRALLAGLSALALLACRTASEAPLEATAAGQPALYAEPCGSCHAELAQRYAHSLHAGKRLACGVCHTPAAHDHPVSDARCGGCHSAQLQQVVRSAHFATRRRLPLDTDRGARSALRAAGYVVWEEGRGHFAGDARSGARGGRLCAGCHLDGHRFGLAQARAPDACTRCHTDRADHFAIELPGFENRCIACHVRAGETVAGQTVDSHRFAVPGS